MLALCAGVPITLMLAGLGVRVLLRAREAGATTDALVGVYFLSMGLGGAPALLANDPAVFGPSAAPIAMAVGHAVLSVGFSALYVFVWRCYGTRSSWRRGLAMTGCAALVTLYVLQAVIERFEPPGGIVVRLTALVRAGALVWALSESVRYWRLMERRIVLGLSDPLVANRFLLWCLWMGGMLAAIGIAIAIRFLFPGFGPNASPLVRVAVITPFALLCAVASLSLWLAFFAPPWYTRWLSGDGPAHAG